MPSNTPIAIALRPQSDGTSPRDRQISTPDSLGAGSSRGSEYDEGAQPTVALLPERDDGAVRGEDAERTGRGRLGPHRLAVGQSLRVLLGDVHAGKRARNRLRQRDD